MQMVCQIEGCDESVFVKSRGWCRRHYHRWHRTGDPLKAAYERHSGPDRWRRKYRVVESGCWEWTASLDASGYGQYDETHGGEHKNHRAHRFVYEQLVGRVPDHLSLDHLCRNRKCVNPEHLEAVPHAENVARGEAGKRNRVKTHCAQGHPFDALNTKVDSRGWRTCLTCSRVSGNAATKRYRQSQMSKRSPES